MRSPPPAPAHRLPAGAGHRRSSAWVYGCCGWSRTCVGRAALDDDAAAHHDDVVAHLTHDGEVVRDEQVGDAGLRRGCRRAGSAPGPGPRRRATRPPRRGSGRAAARRGRGRWPRAAAGRPRGRAGARPRGARRGRPGRAAPGSASRAPRRSRSKCSRRTSSRQSRTRCRRSSDEYGSWKTICTSRPKPAALARAQPAVRALASRRSKMRPEVGRSRPMIMRAVVVLPEPDSPTMASEPPGATAKATSSTAT